MSASRQRSSGKKAGLTDVGHGGGQQGTSTFIMLVPDQRAGVVILINMDGVDAAALATDVMKIVVGAPSEAARLVVSRRLTS
ncbi:MAG: hypothetical protein LAO24_17385 [Acidobacteriia bacterium]|nr:hypothetical protein [Terriglobia bacterium]